MSPEIALLILFSIIIIGLGAAFYFMQTDKSKLKNDIIQLTNQNNLMATQTAKLIELNINFSKENSEIKDSNYDLATLNEEYSLFVRRVHSVLDQDIGFLQGELAQKLSLDIPEVQSLHQGLQRLRNDISAIKDIVEESERIKNE